MLYEDIRIGRGITALHAALDTCPSDDHRELRYHVRRVVLPYTYTATPMRHPPPALELLALLPQVQVLVRPPIITRYARVACGVGAAVPVFSYPTGAPALPALRRLEWAFEPTGNAARAGGINALDDVLRVTPALEELVLSGAMPTSTLRHHHIRLRALRTLRLTAGAAACPLVARQVAYLALPALDTLVLLGAARADSLEPLVEAFAAQVRVLELGPGVPSLEAHKIIAAFPALEELNVHVGGADTGAGRALRVCAHDKLRRVGLCVDSQEWDGEIWSAAVGCVEKFVEGCSALQDIVLFARGVHIPAENPQFDALRESVRSHGRQLQLHPLSPSTRKPPIQSVVSAPPVFISSEFAHILWEK